MTDHTDSMSPSHTPPSHVAVGLLICIVNMMAAAAIWLIALSSAGVYAMEHFELKGDGYLPLFLAVPPSLGLGALVGGFIGYYMAARVWPLSKTRACLGAMLLPFGVALSCSMIALLRMLGGILAAYPLNF